MRRGSFGPVIAVRRDHIDPLIPAVVGKLKMPFSQAASGDPSS
jgi:hypothetical protein